MNKTKSTAGIKLTSYVKAIRISAGDKSIGIDLTPQQAAKLALLLAAAAQEAEWRYIAITGYRHKKQITVCTTLPGQQ
jgi:hypothetical protein